MCNNKSMEITTMLHIKTPLTPKNEGNHKNILMEGKNF
jgi:hypothetical protein